MSFVTSVYPGRWGGGGNSANERGEDARRLALRGVNFWILVSLRVFWARSHHS